MPNTNEILTRFACYDSDIMQGAPRREQRKSRLSGGFLLLLLCLSLIGNAYAFYLIFQNLIFSVFFAAFCSLFFLNIYRLILATTGTNLLPHVAKKWRPVMSYFYKLGYILFFTIISSKPLELLIFSKAMAPKLKAYESAQIAGFSAKLDSVYGKEIAVLKKELQKTEAALNEVEWSLNQRKDSLSKTYLISTQSQLKDKLLKQEASLLLLQNDTQKNIAKFKKQINKSLHFTQRLKILFSDYPLSWWISFACFIIFAMPYFYRLGFVLRGKKRLTYYEKTKAAIEDHIIRSSYTDFKDKYREAMQLYTGQAADFHEFCEDPPYNTVRIQVKAEKKKLGRTYSFKKWLTTENAD